MKNMSPIGMRRNNERCLARWNAGRAMISDKKKYAIVEDIAR